MIACNDQGQKGVQVRLAKTKSYSLDHIIFELYSNPSYSTSVGP